MNYSSRYERKKQTEPKRQWWKIIIWILILGLGYYSWTSLSYSSDLDAQVSEIEDFQIFFIESGESPTHVSERLENLNLIISNSSFLKYLTAEKLDTKIYKGRYSLSSHFTIPEIAHIITTPAEKITITIPEGFTIAEIDSRLAKKGVFEEGEFLQCIQSECSFPSYSFLPFKRDEFEGYFFPATYSIKQTDLTPKTLAIEMLSAFQQRIKKHDLDSHESRSISDFLIMASLIEKESSKHDGDESAMIAGILWNRIEQNIPLGVDASTRYALKKKSDALTVSDLNHNGKFNTRKHKGLPPYAISAPGDASLNAARNPADTDFLFYLHDKNGIIHYAKTNAGHERNKTKFCGASCE